MSTVATQTGVIVHRYTIYLADNEWGHALYQSVAKEYADQHKDCWPLIATVTDRTGWEWLYLFGLPGVPEDTICGMTKDCEYLLPLILEFNKRVRDVVDLGYERRE